MKNYQPGILDQLPSHSRYLEFRAVPNSNVESSILGFIECGLIHSTVVGIGPALALNLGNPIDGLRTFPSLTGNGCEVPSTQSDLWIWLRGVDPGEIAVNARAIKDQLAPDFELARSVNGFKFDVGRDLSGYIDGTENPQGDDAFSAAVVNQSETDLDGSSFVAVQQWTHDLGRFDRYDQTTKDNMIGRRQSDDYELEDAPISAHTKRTSPGNFNPKSYIVRRSMPWSDGPDEGLMFVAFGKTLDAFEVQLRRMLGHNDGVVDALFYFTRPITGGYYWCPPIIDGHLNLAALQMRNV